MGWGGMGHMDECMDEEFSAALFCFALPLLSAFFLDSRHSPARLSLPAP
jgi:hypothetical protein